MYNNILVHTCSVIDNKCVNNAFSLKNNAHFKGDKIPAILKGHMINRVLHMWSIYMKFIKLVKDLLHKFHI